MKSAEQSKAIVRQGTEALLTQAGDLEALDEIYAQDYVGHAPPFPDIIGLEAARGFALGYRQAFPTSKPPRRTWVPKGTRWWSAGRRAAPTRVRRRPSVLPRATGWR